MYHAIPTFYHYLPPDSHFFPPSGFKLGGFPTKSTPPPKAPGVGVVMRHAKCLLRATLNVTSGRAGMKRNEAENCRIGLQKSEIEVEAPENWGAPR